MTARHRRTLTWTLGIAVVAVAAVPITVRALRTPTDLLQGKVFGTPPAEVFEEDYTGAPVQGDSVSYLPNVAPLLPGNRTHDVRVDIVAQEIEIAPGVRYQAWTFGGTV